MSREIGFERNTSPPDELRTTLTNDDNVLIPVIIKYRIEGYKQVDIESIHADMPGELGPDISEYFENSEAVFCVELGIEWKKPTNQHYRGDN